MQNFKNLSRDSSGANLECDFVIKNAFAKAQDLEHKYQNKYAQRQAPMDR